MSDASTPEPTPQPEPRPDVRERWWWTGTFRAVLGGAVVGYQWPVISRGEAVPLTWVVAGLGAVVAVWGLWLLVTAYRARSAPPTPRR
ncbi:hypothetical protein [Cellulomonas carbonis]|uniref:Uncharacterized protein n=1 Tax=Cellulomonas carbonis T26 TaxID=947969 RepID=A0A0A0BVS4_9CELL|nr:hypothetical protein [Cellulomonas carbonis]KGM11752.1 hypothetical protein N868_07540 [Cellulomonas carbonis T26]GGB94546.1 hypothetical protein GCM10010972_04030 [Cellulomonas carbonis]